MARRDLDLVRYREILHVDTTRYRHAESKASLSGATVYWVSSSETYDRAFGRETFKAKISLVVCSYHEMTSPLRRYGGRCGLDLML